MRSRETFWSSSSLLVAFVAIVVGIGCVIKRLSCYFIHEQHMIWSASGLIHVILTTVIVLMFVVAGIKVLKLAIDEALGEND